MGLNYTRGSTIVKTTKNNDREVVLDDEETETIRGESRHPTKVLHVANISPRLTGHHVREIFNAYQLNENNSKNEHRGIENVSFGHGRKFCRVQFRELEDAEYARENLDGGEIDGREIKVAFVDSVSCVEKGGVGGAAEERRSFGGFGGYENNRNNTFDNNNGRGDSGTFRGRRRDFGGWRLYYEQQRQ